MPWLLVVIAGLLEAGWVIGLKHSQGFTRPVPSILTVLGITASLYLLAVAARTLPIGTAYAVWVGIGTLGAVFIGIVFSNEPATPARLFFLAMLTGSIVGLKLTSHGT